MRVGQGWEGRSGVSSLSFIYTPFTPPLLLPSLPLLCNGRENPLTPLTFRGGGADLPPDLGMTDP
jgi:hypothetical protein